MVQLSKSLSVLLFLLLDCRDIFVASTTPPSFPATSFLNQRSTSPLETQSTKFSSDYLLWVDSVLWDLRGGASGDYDEYDEMYDEYDSEEEEEDDEPVARRGPPGRNRGPANRSTPQPGYNRNNPQRGRRPSRKSSSSSSLSSATKLATKSLSATGNLAWKALVKTPGKLAFHVIRPKHVDLVETFGLWRLDQQVVEKSNRRGNEQRTITSVATVEFVRPPMPPREGKSRRGPRRGPLPPPLVVVDKDGDDKENAYRAPYTFSRKNKYLKGASLSSFQTSFVAPAFLVGDQTRLYGYKGTWQRKLADKSVIKLKGKIYQVHKQKFGKKRGEYVYGPAVGTFVMRRRVSMSKEDYDDDETDDEDYDEYDDEDEYDEDVDEFPEDEYDDE